MTAPSSSRAGALVAYAALAMAVLLGNGHFLSSAIVWLALATAAAAWLTFGSGDATLRFARHLGNFALPALLIAFLLAGARPPGIHLRGPEWAIVHALLCGAAAIAATWFFASGEAHAAARRRAFFVLCALGFGMKVLLLSASPRPVIDVFAVLQGGAEALLSGENPYAAAFPSPYAFSPAAIDAYMYPPLTLLVTAPFNALFNDVRVAMIACEAATFWLLLRLGDRRANDATRILALLFLFHPRALFVLEQAWTEPIAALCFVGFLAACARERAFVAAMCAGLFLASKQYLVLVAPFVLLGLYALARRRAALGGAGAALRQLALLGTVALLTLLVVTLPFALWNPAAFIADVWTFHWDSPWRDDALNFSTLLSRAGLVRVPEWASLVWALLALGAGLWLWWRSPRNGVAGIALGAGTTLFFALLFQKHAFCNYYHLVGVCFLAGIASNAAAEPFVWPQPHVKGRHPTS